MPISINAGSGYYVNPSSTGAWDWNGNVPQQYAQQLTSHYEQQRRAMLEREAHIARLNQAAAEFNRQQKEREAAIKSDPFYSHPNFKVIQKIRAMNQKRKEAGYAF